MQELVGCMKEIKALLAKQFNFIDTDQKPCWRTIEINGYGVEQCGSCGFELFIYCNGFKNRNSPWMWSFFRSILSKRGMRYAPLFPVPFLARARISLPDRAMGMLSSFWKTDKSNHYNEKLDMTDFFGNKANNHEKQYAKDRGAM